MTRIWELEGEPDVFSYCDDCDGECRVEERQEDRSLSFFRLPDSADNRNENCTEAEHPTNPDIS